MFFIKMDCCWFLLIVLFKMKFLEAQEVNNPGPGNQTNQPSLQSRFYDLRHRGMQRPESSGMYRNEPNNYPYNSYPSYENQNDNLQRPEIGWRPNNQNPNRPFYRRKPYQPSENYQGNPNLYQRNPNTYRRRGFDGEFNPGFDNMNQNPDYQRPPYQNLDANGMRYPGNINRPNQHGRMPFNRGNPNQPMGMPGNIPSNEYPTENGQYPPHRNFPDNPNVRPGNPDRNFRPDYPDDVNDPDSSIRYPENNGPFQSDENYPENSFNNQDGLGLSSRPSNNVPSDNNEYYTNNQGNNDRRNQLIHQGDMNRRIENNQPESNLVFQGNLNRLPQSRPRMANNQSTDSINGLNSNDKAAILGKPVFVPSSTPSSDQLVFDGR